ncbi:uncharacterized protein LOC118610668 [Rousettus aegyptiacus]|uniref:uncharacterized protein LOC118610668 n=1 Tax=Rousettus aegyptiacus TaxID=9407 RepID=UPI00168D2E74|nr:uncharacterized protein LOC118610668 [Rousettus aegyptiacus]
MAGRRGAPGAASGDGPRRQRPLSPGGLRGPLHSLCGFSLPAGLRRALSQPARPALLGFARAPQSETSAVCSWRLKSRNRERKFEGPHQEARRPLLRAQAPAPPPGAPRAHSDRGLKTTQEKNGPKFFPCKRHPHSRARFAVGCAATLLPTQIRNAPPAYSLVLTPGRPHAAFCLTCTFFSAISSVHGRALHEKWPITHRDEIGPGRGRGAGRKVSDWRRAVLPSQPVRLLLREETVEETRGQETEAEGPQPWPLSSRIARPLTCSL